MDPSRLVATLSIVLALAGIGGAFRACGSLGRSGGSVGRAGGSLGRAAHLPARLPTVPRHLTGQSSLRRGAAAGAATSLGDDAARGGSRASGARGGAVKQLGGNADGLLDMVGDDDDDRPRAPRRR